MERTGIYIHIPFCKRKCFYCHFVKGNFDKELVDRYIDALVEELRLRSTADYTIDTIYMGGGSPSLLEEKQLMSVIDALHKYFNIHDTIEFTIEANPEDVTIEKLKIYKKLGINRISIGTQSFVPTDLEYLKRNHSTRQSLSAVQMALETGFSNINLDFIIGLPTQDKKKLEENFAVLKTFDIPHISAYLLEDVEEGEEKNARDHDLYFFTVHHLAALGYAHYEVSNFSKPKCQSRHNLKYWNNKSYIGAGLSASGYEKGTDYRNAASFNSYFKKIGTGKLPFVERTRRNPGIRGIVMGLRLLEGIPFHSFRDFPEQTEFLLSNRFLIKRNGCIAVNPGKILLLNEILTYFIP